MEAGKKRDVTLNFLISESILIPENCLLRDFMILARPG